MKWQHINFEEDEIHICNAYKDYAVYNSNGEKIGRRRGDGSLKNDVSYRTIPLNERLKKQLLIHIEKQQTLYKKIERKWDESCYVFLNQYHKPFVPDNLTKGMNRIVTQIEFEHMTPYGLRHSFATFWSQQGMEPEVLMSIMGHSKYDTTLEYYISVTKKRKKDAMKIKDNRATA